MENLYQYIFNLVASGMGLAQSPSREGHLFTWKKHFYCHRRGTFLIFHEVIDCYDQEVSCYDYNGHVTLYIFFRLKLFIQGPLVKQCSDH